MIKLIEKELINLILILAKISLKYLWIQIHPIYRQKEQSDQSSITLKILQLHLATAKHYSTHIEKKPVSLSQQPLIKLQPKQNFDQFLKKKYLLSEDR